MPRFPVDPASLEGEALNRWYQRTPDEIQAERRAVEEERYREFFGSQRPEAQTASADPDGLWVANGYGGYRPVRSRKDDFLATIEENEAHPYPTFLPNNAAAPEGAVFTEVGNPHNPRLVQEWERANGRSWPRTADGRPYDVAHIRAIADGGANTLDNIRPMGPAEHRASHVEDYPRWGRRSGIARAYGGRVEPPAHAPLPRRESTVKGLGILGILPNITGIMSGRIRTDTPAHFWSDMLGVPIEDDRPPKGDIVA